jgi:hypothetical protein
MDSIADGLIGHGIRMWEVVKTNHVQAASIMGIALMFLSGAVGGFVQMKFWRLAGAAALVCAALVAAIVAVEYDAVAAKGDTWLAGAFLVLSTVGGFFWGWNPDRRPGRPAPIACDDVPEHVVARRSVDAVAKAERLAFMPPSSSVLARQTLWAHVNVGRAKPVSYLPIKTIESVLGISVAEYETMIAQAGNSSIVIAADTCCIESGVVYAYSAPELMLILDRDAELLAGQGWPTVPEGFLIRLASDWLPDNSPLMRIVKAAFGDDDP